MPQICVISDCHGMRSGLYIPPADWLIHAGDYSAVGDRQDAIWFLQWLEAQPHRVRIFTNGNHDGHSQDYASDFANLVSRHAPSCYYLHDRSIEIDGIKVHGSSWSPTFYDWWWNADRGAAIKAHWDLIPKDTQVLVTHGPPAGILDISGFGNVRVGCADLAETINTLPALKLSCFGHIHASYGIEDHGGVTYVNASICNERYAPINPARVIQIDL